MSNNQVEGPLLSIQFDPLSFAIFLNTPKRQIKFTLFLLTLNRRGGIISAHSLPSSVIRVSFFVKRSFIAFLNCSKLNSIKALYSLRVTSLKVSSSCMVTQDLTCSCYLSIQAGKSAIFCSISMTFGKIFSIFSKRDKRSVRRRY